MIFNKDANFKYVLKSSTLRLLRIPFSFFLMPVYWFAVSQADHINIYRTALIFIILHFFLYPASNAYNSYMDRDTASIGLLEHPPLPTKQVFYISILFDMIALGLSFLISLYFVIATVGFIAASRAYSYRGIRLKKHAIVGYLIAIFFQGGVVYFMVFHGSSEPQTLNASFPAMIASALLVGSFFPLTQIYQHEQDRKDSVRTMSILLGYRGTFIFSALVCFAALLILGYYFIANLESERFLVVLICMLPVLFYFIRWFLKVKKDPAAADYQSSTRMNIITAVCMNTAFIILLMLK